MCGITGHYQYKRDRAIDEAPLRRALECLKKRGPDSQKFDILPGMGLGHTRLQIIDLHEVANQPMVDASGRYSIVYNGEIFNYRELRQELGGPWQTQSDTEVLLKAYIRWQEKCLDKLNGFFSFVIYDRENHSLFAARDRFGIKPFLYAEHQAAFYFASELKALCQYPIPRDISAPALNAFFQLSYIPGEQSIFQSVQRLLPAHYLKIEQGKLSTHCYYKLNSQPSSLSFTEAQEKLKSLCQQATEKWIVSDAPLGAFLSGGIDSSVVVALASQKIKNLRTFSVSFPDAPFHDESRFARAVAQRYQTDHCEIPLTRQNIFSCVDQVLDYLDEPFADTSAIPTFALCQQVGQQVKVALSGDGADEIFGGYEKHRAEFLAHKYQRVLRPLKYLFPLTKNLPESRDGRLGNQFRKLNRLLKGLSLSESERYLQWCSFVDPQTLDHLLTDRQPQKPFAFTQEQSFQGLNRTLYCDTQMVLPNDMLSKVDMMSMANSIEVRPLFLDHSIADFVFSLPAHYKVTAQKKKHILVETFKDLLPEEVYCRPKHGFTVELMPFFRDQFWGKINDVYLNEKLIREQGLFIPEKIEELKKQIQNGQQKDLQTLVWELITFQNFWMKYR